MIDEHGECRHEIKTLQAKLDRIVSLFRNSVPMQNFIRERHRITFQMQGRFDGSMGDGCKALFAEEYKTLSELIELIAGDKPPEGAP